MALSSQFEESTSRLLSELLFPNAPCGFSGSRPVDAIAPSLCLKKRRESIALTAPGKGSVCHKAIRDYVHQERVRPVESTAREHVNLRKLSIAIVWHYEARSLTSYDWTEWHQIHTENRLLIRGQVHNHGFMVEPMHR
jgi:hypothetical protein